MSELFQYSGKQDKNLILMSTVLHPIDNDGNFDWAPAVWLVYHESFRRELARLIRALSNFNPLQDAWKSIALYRWLTEFFLPSIQHYEMGKREFTKPFYESKGHVLSPELSYAQDHLEGKLGLISLYAQECLELSMSDNLFPKKIKDSVYNLKKEISELNHVLIAHYDAEERFWPDVFAKEGLPVWNKILHKMLVHNRKVNPTISNYIFAMVFHSIGYNLKYLSMEDPLDRPWCGFKTRFTFVKRAPFIVKALPLVAWMNDYLKYKSMINSVHFLVEDEHDYERRYRIFQRQQERLLLQQEAWLKWQPLLYFFPCIRVPQFPTGIPSSYSTDNNDGLLVHNGNLGSLPINSSNILSYNHSNSNNSNKYKYIKNTKNNNSSSLDSRKSQSTHSHPGLSLAKMDEMHSSRSSQSYLQRLSTSVSQANMIVFSPEYQLQNSGDSARITPQPPAQDGNPSNEEETLGNNSQMNSRKESHKRSSLLSRWIWRTSPKKPADGKTVADGAQLDSSIIGKGADDNHINYSKSNNKNKNSGSLHVNSDTLKEASQLDDLPITQQQTLATKPAPSASWFTTKSNRVYSATFNTSSSSSTSLATHTTQLVHGRPE